MRLFIVIFWLAVFAPQAFSAVTVSVNGSNHTIPQTNEKGWGTNVTAWIQAISQFTLQPNGGTFTLTAEVDTGSTYGFKVPYIKTATATPATTGVLRLAVTDSIGWRNNANGANLLLAVDSSDNLTFNGGVVSTPTTGTFQDSTFNIYDNGDSTKKIAFQASGITTSTTRTITMPDANVDLSDISTATSSNTASKIVKRDGSGDFSAGTITAALAGNASTATALASNPSDCSADTYATAIAASGDLTCGTVTNAGLAGSIAASKLVGTDIATVGTITSGTWNGTKLGVAYGGTGLTAVVAGDLLTGVGSTSIGTLAIGTTSFVLRSNAGVPVWAAPSVSSTAASAERIERATITCSASSSVAAQSGSWISVGNISSGTCNLTFTSGTFSAVPACTATINSSVGGAVFGTQLVVSSTTAATLNCQVDTGGSAAIANCTDISYHIICMGLR